MERLFDFVWDKSMGLLEWLGFFAPLGNNTYMGMSINELRTEEDEDRERAYLEEEGLDYGPPDAIDRGATHDALDGAAEQGSEEAEGNEDPGSGTGSGSGSESNGEAEVIDGGADEDPQDTYSRQHSSSIQEL